MVCCLCCHCWSAFVVCRTIGAVFTADSDLLALGCRMIIRSINHNTRTIAVATSTSSVVELLRDLATTASTTTAVPSSQPITSQLPADDDNDDTAEDDDDSTTTVHLPAALFDSETTTSQDRAYVSTILGNDYLPGGVQRVGPTRVVSIVTTQTPKAYVDEIFKDESGVLRAFMAATQTFLYTPVFDSNAQLTYDDFF